MKSRHALLALTSVTACASIICFPHIVSAQTSVTIYSSAQPGTLSHATFRNGGEGLTVPGYGVIRQTQDVNLTKGRTVIRISDVPALIDPTSVLFEEPIQGFTA